LKYCKGAGKSARGEDHNLALTVFHVPDPSKLPFRIEGGVTSERAASSSSM